VLLEEQAQQVKDTQEDQLLVLVMLLPVGVAEPGELALMDQQLVVVQLTRHRAVTVALE
jgi:hypothetical protein